MAQKDTGRQDAVGATELSDKDLDNAHAGLLPPGGIADTEGLSRFGGPQDGSKAAPLGRFGTKRDIANAVLFLVSDAANFVSGQVFCVDGASGVDALKLDLGD